MPQRRLLLLILSAGALVAQTTNPFANDAQAAGVGKGIFRIYCAPCHGIRGQGGRGPDLTRAVNAADRDAGLFHTISLGVPGTEMESYGSLLTDDNIWRIVAYIRSLSQGAATAKASGDASRGRALFWEKGACGNCHVAEGKGGRSGPNLSRIGRQRSAEFLRESVVRPSADITPGYRTITVVLPGGGTIVGLERGLDNFTVQLTDLAGKFYSFDRTQLTSVRRETRSLMPETYSKSFTSSELDDLVAYLSTLRGEASKP